MTTEEAAAIVNAIASALAREPNQFHFTVEVVGMRSVASGPGATGVVFSATGGSGSGTTVGGIVSAEMSDVTIAKAEAAVGTEIGAVLADLYRLAGAVESGNKSRVGELYAALQTHVALPASLLGAIATSLQLAGLT